MTASDKSPIDGTAAAEIVCGVAVMCDARRPCPIDAIVREEDTCLVLSADPEFRATSDHPIRLLDELHRVEPLDPGAVVVRTGAIVELLAVVHDLGRDPTWTRRWIGSALDAVFRETRERSIRCLGLPILGTVHGTLPRDDGLRMITAALERHRGAGLRRLWLMEGGSRDRSL